MCPAASVFSQHSLREALDHIYDSVPQLNLALVDSVVCGPILTITITITHSTHQDKIKPVHIIIFATLLPAAEGVSAVRVLKSIKIGTFIYLCRYIIC